MERAQFPMYDEHWFTSLAAIEHNARNAFVPVMAEDSAALLADQVYTRKPLRILEIGTAVGYSGLLMLGASPEAKLVTIDFDEGRLETARTNFSALGVSSRVQIIAEDVYYALPLLSGTFDFILLDGPKGHYREMLPTLLTLLSDAGCIFVDDVAYLGLVDGKDYPEHKHRTIVTNMREFIAATTNDTHLMVRQYPTTSGVLTIEKRRDY